MASLRRPNCIFGPRVIPSFFCCKSLEDCVGTFTAGLCIYQGKHRNGSLRGTRATLSVYSIVPDQVLPGTAKPQGSHASFEYQGRTMRRRHSPQQSCIYSSIYSGQCLTTTRNQFHPSARVCRLKCTHPINPTFLLVRCIRL